MRWQLPWIIRSQNQFSLEKWPQLCSFTSTLRSNNYSLAEEHIYDVIAEITKKVSLTHQEENSSYMCKCIPAVRVLAVWTTQNRWSGKSAFKKTRLKCSDFQYSAWEAYITCLKAPSRAVSLEASYRFLCNVVSYELKSRHAFPCSFPP